MRLTQSKASRPQNLRSRVKRGLKSESLESRKLLAAAIMDTALDVQSDQVPAMVANGSSAMDHSGPPIAFIVNGQQTSDYESVGVVNGGCTGTLISPTHVLTAAHCVEGNGANGFIGDREGTFEVGGETYRTTKITVHPKYNIDNFGAGYDIAIMELDRPVEGITPSEIHRNAPQVGQELTLVGFGEAGTTSNPDYGFGTKHVGTTPIDSITNEHISWTLDSQNESATAPGDSGGPAFVQVDGELVVAGVTSGGSGNAHQIGAESFDTRVDVLANWIDAQVESTTPGNDIPGDGEPDTDNPGDDQPDDSGPVDDNDGDTVDDGQLSPVELASQELEDYDSNEDGSLSVKELTREFQDYGLNQQDAKAAARELRNQFDEDANGRLSLSELIVSWGGSVDDVTDPVGDGSDDDGPVDDGPVDGGSGSDGPIGDFDEGSPEQLAIEELELYDTNNDEALSISELTEEFREMGYGNGQASGIAQDLVQVFDTNGDELLDFSELVVSWGGQAVETGDGTDEGDIDEDDIGDGNTDVDSTDDDEPSIAAEKAAEELALYDGNNNGKLSKKELKTEFLDMGMSKNEAKALAAELIENFDSDGDNQLSLAELTASWGGTESGSENGSAASDSGSLMDETFHDDIWAEDTDWLESEIGLYF